MNLTMSYYGHSGLRPAPGGGVLSLAPNLNRDRVAFDAPLRQPLVFREAMSALHDVVIGDLRYKPRDKTAYKAWKAEQTQRDAAVHRAALAEAQREIAARRAQPIPPELSRQFEKARKQYWGARQSYANYLLKNDPTLWRQLMPCDPIVTVADDSVLFECFSLDESSYGCLTVERDGGFGNSDVLQLGTTNVDYSWDLYDHFQSLRTYRQTRLCVDPAGFEVRTQDTAHVREEQIDLPRSWLRGFVQLQAGMMLPMRHVPVSIDAAYSVIAWLKRHRERRSPRAIRFELQDGRAPTLVLEPWEQRIECHGVKYDGPDGEPVRIWGRRRLSVLARLLPIADRIDVYLLGTGFPSFWVVTMGSMRLALALSGWTVNDWTAGSALDSLAPPEKPQPQHIGMIADLLQRERSATFTDIDSRLGGPKEHTATALNYLANAGQVIYDLAAQRYRWRQVLPTAIGEAEVGPPEGESFEAQVLIRRALARIDSREPIESQRLLVKGRVESAPCEVIIDADGVIRGGTCKCSHHYRAGIRRGPCRHLQALRWASLHSREGAAIAPQPGTKSKSWYESLAAWAGG